MQRSIMYLRLAIRLPFETQKHLERATVANDNSNVREMPFEERFPEELLAIWAEGGNSIRSLKDVR